MLARYMQTVSGIPGLAALSFGNGLVLLLVGHYLWQRTDRRVWRSRVLWLFMAVVAGRGITNMLAARFTLAIYVQLVTLATPFLVALLGRTLFQQRIPRYTIAAISLSLVGALLMMGGSLNPAALLAAGITPLDLAGIGLAFVSTLCLSFYLLLLRHAVQVSLAGEAMYLVQLLSLTVVSGSLSLLSGEDWSRWLALDAAGWTGFAAFALGVVLASSIFQMSAVRQLGAPMVSSMFGWRLVSTLLLSALLLGEHLSTIWQGVGAVLVVVTISAYVWYNATHPAAE